MKTQTPTLEIPESNDETFVTKDIAIPQESIDSFEVKKFSAFGWIKFFLGLIFLFPIRLILTLLSVGTIMTCYLIFICFIGPGDQPQPKITRIARRIIGAGWARFVMYVYGFFWISENGKFNKSAKMIVANHSSCFDMFFFIWKISPSFVVAEFVGKNFFLGPLSRLFNCPVIDRKSSGNSSSFLKKLEERLSTDDDKFPPCMIFPEGATSNGQCLNYFHSGSFVPGAPMQPVILTYKDSITPTQWSVRSWPFHYLSVMCNFTNRLEVTYLPVYHPSEAEKAHPRLYAQNVKNAMSHALSMVSGKRFDASKEPLLHSHPLFFPQTQLGYRDRKAYEKSRRLAEKAGKTPQPRSLREICAAHIRHNYRNMTTTTMDTLFPVAPAGASSTAAGPASTSAPSLVPATDRFSSLFFALPCPTEAFDFHLRDYYSQCTFPSDSIMAILEPRGKMSPLEESPTPISSNTPSSSDTPAETQYS